MGASFQIQSSTCYASAPAQSLGQCSDGSLSSTHVMKPRQGAHAIHGSTQLASAASKAWLSAGHERTNNCWSIELAPVTPVNMLHYSELLT